MTNQQFYFLLKKYGVNFASGVPCAILKRILFCFMKNLEIQYISAAREEDAIGIAVGAYLAGKRPIVLMQNSGLANCVNCLTSLLIPSKIPVLFLVSWRGCPKEKDEPMYHYVMGKTGIGLMKKIGINVQIVSKKDPENSILNSIKKMRKNHLPSVIFLRRHLLL